MKNRGFETKDNKKSKLETFKLINIERIGQLSDSGKKSYSLSPIRIELIKKE